MAQNRLTIKKLQSPDISFIKLNKCVDGEEDFSSFVIFLTIIEGFLYKIK